MVVVVSPAAVGAVGGGAVGVHPDDMDHWQQQDPPEHHMMLAVHGASLGPRLVMSHATHAWRGGAWPVGMLLAHVVVQ